MQHHGMKGNIVGNMMVNYTHADDDTRQMAEQLNEKKKYLFAARQFRPAEINFAEKVIAT